MEQKAFVLQNKGMNRDLSISKAGESSAYDNHNIRLTAQKHNTLLSVTNERGNKQVTECSFTGTLLGYAVLNDYIILFTTDGANDYIYRVEYTGSTFKQILIFKGDLSFDVKHPIETLVDYETEDIQKVYWIDGKNVLRFLNFSDSYLKKHLKSGELYNNPVFIFADETDWFDSTRAVDNTPDVVIEKDNSGNSRPNGVAQYFLTYFNKNGQQTGIVYVSPLVYFSPQGRGGATDEVNNNKVTFTLSNLDVSYEYVYLYQIIRTSFDSQVSAYLIGEVATSTGTVTIVDDGSHNSAIDPMSFLYLGSQSVIASTMTQKDGTLFLGGLSSVGNKDIDILETAIKETAFNLNGTEFEDGTDWESAIVSFKQSSTKELSSKENHIPYISADGYYPYENQLKYTNAQISTFKGGEKYRFALQFIRPNGTTSKAFWIGDKVNPYYPKIQNTYIFRAVAMCVLPESIIQVAKDCGFVSVQLMIAQATYADRSVQAQGIVNPTVFNLYDRMLGYKYVQASWINRPRNGGFSFQHFSPLQNSDSPFAEMQCSYWDSNKDNSTVPFPLYHLNSSNGLVEKPNGYVDYDAIKISYVVRAQKLVTKYWGTLTVTYYKGDTVVKESNFGLGGGSAVYNNSKLKLIKDWLAAYETADVPVALRLKESEIREVCEEALDKKKSEDPGTKTNISFTSLDNKRRYSRLNREYFFVDESIVSLNSPEIEYEKVSLDRNSGLKFRIVGASKLTGNMTDYDIETSDAELPGEHKLLYNFSHKNISSDIEGLGSWPFYSEYGYKETSTSSYEKVTAPFGYMMYMWHKNGSIPSFGTESSDTGNTIMWSSLTKKIVANLHFSYKTIYNNYNESFWSVSPSDVRQLSDYASANYEVKRSSGTVIYAGDCDDLVIMPDDAEYPLYMTDKEATPDQLLQLNYVKTVADPVSLTYRSKAHALISLPSKNNQDTILPYMFSSEAFSLGANASDTTGPYVPWDIEKYSGCTLMYREVDYTDATKVADKTQGAFGGFIKQTAGNGKFSAYSVNTTTVSAIQALQESLLQYSNRAVYIHLIDGTTTTYLVDAQNMTVVNTEVSGAWASQNNIMSFLLSFKANQIIDSITITLQADDQVATPICTLTADVGTYGYTFDLSKYNLQSYKKFNISYSVSYRTTLIPVLQSSALNVNASILQNVFASHYHCAFLYDAPYYTFDEEETFAKKSFVNIATTPNTWFTIAAKTKAITCTGTYSATPYKEPIQSAFALTQSAEITSTDKYLFIGELYKDYDSSAKTDIALDTRYGGITEAAVESNTFIASGQRVQLSDLQNIQLPPTCTMSIDALKKYISDNTELGDISLKLNTEEVDLSKLNITYLDFLPSKNNLTTELKVGLSSSGSYEAYLTGLSDLQYDYIKAHADEFKIMLMRYGYARRGFWRTYVNKYGETQSTHTQNDTRYRLVRRGYANKLSAKRLRVIGWDLLISSKNITSSWTGSFLERSDYYTKDNVMFSFGSALQLPKLKDKIIMYTSEGTPLSYVDKSRSGTLNLYIALFRKENDEWNRVSNIVQVRGKNAEGTAIWEFEESNIVRKISEEQEKIKA